jgi:TRAP-type C4-dicarboxylate transport system permease small subunit
MNLINMKFIKNAYKSSEQLVISLAMISLFFAMALITINSISRYIFNLPLVETKPITTLYLLIVMVFLITPRLQRQEENINVFFLYDRVSKGKQKIFDIISHAIGLIFVAVLLYTTLIETWHGYQINWYTTGAVRVPIYVSYGLMSLGLVFLLITLFIQLGDDLRRQVESYD